MRLQLCLVLLALFLYLPYSEGWLWRRKPKPPPPQDNKELIALIKSGQAQTAKMLCLQTCASDWSSWSPCNSRCGLGKVLRNRDVTSNNVCTCSKSGNEEGSCNSGCPNGGRPSNNRCVACPRGRTGNCCETELKCKALPRPGNGTVNVAWPPLDGSLATYSCNLGFNLVGDHERLCSRDTWSGAAPTCNAIQCSQPVRTKGVIFVNNATGYIFGDKLYHECEKGYTLVGDRGRTCERGITGKGVWSGYDVECKIVKCPVPTIPYNGKLVGNFSLTYDSYVRFSCDEGYKLIGSDALLCLESGQWLGHSPKCEVITCEPPYVSKHGQVRIRKAGIRTFALFECDEGYRLKPFVPTITCTEDGAWNDTEPRCIAASCGDPGSPENGYSEGGVFTFGKNVTFHCQQGYEMIGGSKEITCGGDARWSGFLPSCEACPFNYYANGRNCSECPPNSFTVSNASTSIVQCQCDQENGFVGPPGGPCEEIFCTSSSPPGNGAVSECGNKVGNSCNFSCSDGFMVERGTTKRTCQNNGEWDGTEPFCVPCQLNTYKSGERFCSPCPLHSHTEESAQMLEGCVCDKGYEGPPGGPCVDIDECLMNNGTGNCSDTCINMDGKFSCGCSIPGYKINPKNALTCVVEKQCQNLTEEDAPSNGGLVCHWFLEENSQHCTAKCNPGYEMPSRVNNYETCGPVTGYKWSHQVNNATEVIDPCIPEFLPGFRMEADSAYFAAKCADLTDEQKTAAKEEFAQRLNNKAVCSRGKTQICRIQDMAIICGKTTRRRKRRGVEYLEHSVDFAYNISALKFEDKVADCHTKICPLLRIPAQHCEKLCAPTYKRYLRATVEFARRNLIKLHQDPSKLMDLTFNVDNLKFEPKVEEFKASDVIQECQAGMMGLDGQCVPCLAGSYLDEENNVCIKCPKNHFQSGDLQTSCISCQEFFGPGFYANNNGSETCQVCPAGRWGLDCLKECNCVHGSCSPMTGTCICPSGWEGDRCEKDVNSCVEGSCFPGVTCIDRPPPEIGFSCGPCPSGYHGDGISCTALLERRDKHLMIDL